MRSEDLINFNISQQWRKARIRFFEEQIENVNRLNSVLSNMPKGSRLVYDNEAESLVKLLDKITDMRNSMQKELEEVESQAIKQLEQLQPKYGLLLYHYYILGDSMKYIAREVIHNELKHTYKLKDIALEEFDSIHEKKGWITNGKCDLMYNSKEVNIKLLQERIREIGRSGSFQFII